MFHRTACLVAASCFLVFHAVRSSGQTPVLQAGTKELSVAGAVNDSDGLALYLQVGAGYFFFDRTELGVVGSYSRADSFIGTWEALTLGLFAEYSFDLQTLLVPFVGIGMSYSDDNIQGSGGILVASTSTGARYFLSDNVALGGNLQFSVANEDMYVSGTDPEGFSLMDNTDLAFMMETRVFF